MLPDARQSKVASIERRLELVKERVAQACQRAGRREQDVTLVAVTKTFPLETIAAAIAAGLRDLGENKPQELQAKAGATPAGACRWHLIGHLQRNKAKVAVRHSYLFHALDSLRLANRLNRLAEASGTILPCLLQVNVSGEDTKFGVPPESVRSILGQMATCEHLNIRGLMTLASPAPNPETVRPQFEKMRLLLDTAPTSGMEILSMGMSGDYEVAIEEGATHVRVGSAIFGPRKIL